MKYVITLGHVIDLFSPSHPAMINAELSSVDCKSVARAGVRVPSKVENGICTFFPAEWREAMYSVVKKVIDDSGIDSKDIVSVSGTAHPDNVILLDRDGEPIPCGLICAGYDFTTEKAEISRLVSREDTVKYIGAGFGVGSMTPAAEILMWHRLNTPDVLEQCGHMLTTKDYFAFCLTGEYATEPTTASFSMLFDPVSGCWSDGMVRALGFDGEILPRIVPCNDVVGTVTQEAAKKTGLVAGTPVLAGATNKACVELLSLSTEDQEAVYSYSIFSNLVIHTKTPVVDMSGNTALCASMLPGEYYIMLDNRTHCHAFNWFGNQFVDGFEAPRGKTGLPYEKTEALAAQSPIGANGVRFLPYLSGEEAPVFDENAKGVFYSITTKTTKADMMRAVMEGTACSARETFAYAEDLGIRLSNLHYRIMGNQPMMAQMLADVTGLPVKLLHGGNPNDGACALQCVACGTWKTLKEAAAALVSEGQVFFPDPAAHAAYETVYRSYRRLYPALKEAFEEDSK